MERGTSAVVSSTSAQRGHLTETAYNGHRVPDLGNKHLWELGRKANWNTLRQYLVDWKIESLQVRDPAAEERLTHFWHVVDFSRSPASLYAVIHELVGPHSNDEAAKLLKRLMALGVDPDMAAAGGVRPAHLANAYQRPECLKVILACRPDLKLVSVRGKAAMDFTSVDIGGSLNQPVGDNPEIRKIWDGLRECGFPSLAQLAQNRDYFALKSLCRRHGLEEKDFLKKYQGKTVVDWLRAYQKHGLELEVSYYFRKIVGPERPLPTDAAGSAPPTPNCRQSLLPTPASKAPRQPKVPKAPKLPSASSCWPMTKRVHDRISMKRSQSSGSSLPLLPDPSGPGTAAKMPRLEAPGTSGLSLSLSMGYGLSTVRAGVNYPTTDALGGFDDYSSRRVDGGNYPSTSSNYGSGGIGHFSQYPQEYDAYYGPPSGTANSAVTYEGHPSTSASVDRRGAGGRQEPSTSSADPRYSSQFVAGMMEEWGHQHPSGSVATRSALAGQQELVDVTSTLPRVGDGGQTYAPDRGVDDGGEQHRASTDVNSAYFRSLMDQLDSVDEIDEVPDEPVDVRPDPPRTAGASGGQVQSQALEQEQPRGPAADDSLLNVLSELVKKIRAIVATQASLELAVDLLGVIKKHEPPQQN